MCCVLFRMLGVPEVMRCVLLRMLEAVEGGSVYGGVGDAGWAVGDAACAALYAGALETRYRYSEAEALRFGGAL